MSVSRDTDTSFKDEEFFEDLEGEIYNELSTIEPFRFEPVAHENTQHTDQEDTENTADDRVGRSNCQVVESHLRRPSFRSSFLLLFVISVVAMVFSLTWWESVPLHVQYHRWNNRTNRINPPPKRAYQNKRVYTANQTNGETKTDLTSTENDTTPVFQYHLAYAQNYRFIMDDTEACKNKTPFLVLMVPVAPSNLAARDAIRKTWGNETLVHGKLVQTLFMLGLPRGQDTQQQQEKVKQESLQYHDLIQSDFMDTYLNLTIKTMVIMNWLATRCPGASYAMKVDSDMFLNIDNLVAMLQKPGIPTQNYLTGMLMWNRPVIRSKASKWYVPVEMYPEPHYPTYTLGMGYVFSNDLPCRFVEISKDIKPFNIEDAYIGMCMKKLGLAPTQPPKPSQFKAYIQAYNRCEFSQIITYILASSQQLVKYWTDLKKPGSPC